MGKSIPKIGCAKLVASILEEITKEHIIIYWAISQIVIKLCIRLHEQKDDIAQAYEAHNFRIQLAIFLLISI